MAYKSGMLKITKREKANILDFTVILLFTEIMLVFFANGFHVELDWRYYVAIPAYFLTFNLIFQYATKLNNILWEYASGRPFLTLFSNLYFSALFAFALTAITFKFQMWQLYMYLSLLFGTFTILTVIKLFILQLYLRKHRNRNLKNAPFADNNNTLIVGAGWTGTTLASGFQNDSSIFKPVAFVDDDYEKRGRQILDIPVAGSTHDIEKVVKEYGIKKIIFAIPSCDRATRKRIISDCVATKRILKVVPPIQEMVNKTDMESIQPRDVRIEDLLGREPMVFDTGEIKSFIHGKVCMVTGGGGSIGSELCRQIAGFKPETLIILDIYENNAYNIQMELKSRFPSLNMEVEICSIADYDKCRVLFERYRPELVFHAAAHKHVPLMEHVPEQAIKNNVVGTLNLCRLSAEFKVSRFLLISTDKAVNPTNVMGASKRCCEMIVKYHAQTVSDTAFCAVRFGNVLGSNGSVIPLFRQQIATGGPVTLTDKNIIRYFMTIPEAVSLVLEANTFSESGEIFVLDMGEPVKILDLAEKMIELSGLTPYRDIDITFTGLRPGEKLFEELLISGESMTKTANQKIYICRQIDVEEKEFTENLTRLITLAKQNKPAEVIEQLKLMLPTYHNENESAG